VATPPFRAGDGNVSLTASVGVALSGAGPAGGVWRKADMAMSRAKEQGGARVEVYAGPDDAPVPVPGDASVPVPGDASVPVPGDASVPVPGDAGNGAPGSHRPPANGELDPVSHPETKLLSS